ncbi:MAG: nickel/cobalt transporter [Spirochaetota bacterium]
MRRAFLFLAVLAVLATIPVAAQNPFMGASGDSGPEIYGARSPELIRAWGRLLQSSIASLSRRVIQGEWPALFAALGVSVLFGFVHIVGPGHGKVFALSYFTARDARPRDGFVYSALVNAVDSFSAFALVMLGYVVLRAVLPTFRTTGPRTLQLVSYGLIAFFGIVHLVSHVREGRSESEGCSLGHSHAPERAVPSGAPWILAVSVGLVPCPVSTVLLVYGVVNDALPLMMLMVAGVSFGGFLAMSAISVAIIAGRGRVVRRLHGDRLRRLAAVVEYAASGLIVVVAATLFLAAL